MKIIKTNLILSLVFLLAIGVTAVSFAEEIFEKKEVREIKEPKWAPGEVIVKFKRGVSDEVIRETNKAQGTSVLAISKRGECQRLRIPKTKTVEEMVEIYSRNPNVEFAEPNFLAQALMVPNDPYYSYQWHFDNSTYGGIHMQCAWDIQTGRPEVIVAVIDTGVAYENYGIYQLAPDLANTLFVPGRDFVNNDDHPNDDESHGTHVTGTIAQSTNNYRGVAGIAFNTSIMPLKVLNSAGSGYYSDIAEAIYFAADHGAQVINMSLGGSSPATVLENALAYAYNKGVTTVCSAGNSYQRGNYPSYPAAYDAYCMAVGATRYDETRSYYSTTGSYLDVAAPGGDIYADQNGDGYGDGVLQQTFNPNTKDPADFAYWFFQGTSMAAPHVSGLAALLIANGVSGPDNIRKAIESTAEDKGTPGWDPEYGWGIIDAHAALHYSITHDLAVAAIKAPLETFQGDLTQVFVTVENQGTSSETTTVNLYDNTDSRLIGSQSVFLEVGSSTILPFVWDTTEASIGDHILEAEAIPVVGEKDIADNSMTTTINIKQKIIRPSLRVSNITLSLLNKGQNFQAQACVTIIDQDGNPVGNVLVTGEWTFNGGYLNTMIKPTRGKFGRATLNSSRVRAKSGDIFTLTITNVAKEGYTYDPENNTETSDSIIVP